jgi:DNA-binding transcriptional regulator YiaG
MPNIASVLKSEISRLSRKEIRAETIALKKAATAYRSEIAALKKRTQALEQQMRRLGKRRSAGVPVDEQADGESKRRFSAKGFASMRRRLDLSADQFAALLGASRQSIYNWEKGSARPLAAHLPAIAALRTMGKRDVLARLEALQER